MIAISVRLNGQLAAAIGAPRLQLSLPAHATVTHLLAVLAEQYPAARQLLAQAIPFIEGRHVGAAAPLAGVNEVALLMPVAGG